jgi:hypothetical protein
LTLADITLAIKIGLARLPGETLVASHPSAINVGLEIVLNLIVAVA